MLHESINLAEEIKSVQIVNSNQLVQVQSK